jgi:acyl carrier protein
MEQSEFVALVAEILEVDPATVSLTDSLDDIDWDSLANISFIAEIDTRFNAQIDADELAKASTVADLKTLVDRVAKVAAD